jgi:hypothetical protein
VQAAYRPPNQQDQKRNTCQTHHNQNTQHTEQGKYSKAEKEKRQVTHKGKPIRIAAHFSTQTLNARRSWKDKSGPERKQLSI